MVEVTTIQSSGMPASTTRKLVDNGVAEDVYRYTQDAYSSSGEVKTVKMNEHRSAPLREGALFEIIGQS